MFTLMEMEVIKKMCTFVGYTSGDGIFCPGEAIILFQYLYMLHIFNTFDHFIQSNDDYF